MKVLELTSRGHTTVTLTVENGLIRNISHGDRTFQPDKIVIELWTISDILRGHHQNTFRASQMPEWPENVSKGVIRKIVREFSDRGVVFVNNEIHILV